MSNKLSVVISVGKAPGLKPSLPGAYTGAQEFAAWAESQGHRVITFSDASGAPFSARDIEDAITPDIDNQVLSELLIYYAGHGECFGLEEDYWLLRKDRARGGDIIDVGATVRLARRAGVPRVVIIADACRTIGDRTSLALKDAAAPILPPRDFDAVSVDVDRYWAAGPGSASLEVQEREKAANAYGVFSKLLLQALRGNVSEVHERSDDGTLMVVRGGKLKMFLQKVVPLEAAKLPNGYSQRPDCQCESSQPLSVIGTVPKLAVTIGTVLKDGSPVSESTITIFINKGLDAWEQLEKQSGPTATFLLPSGVICKSNATGSHKFVPENPMPLFELNSPISGRFVAQPTLPSPLPKGSILAMGPIKGQMPEVAAVTRVMDSAGRTHHEAPSPGVFPVVTYDLLTGEMASEIQEFQSPGQSPVPVLRSGDWVQRVSEINSKASIQAQRGFEMHAGLTLLGIPVEPRPRIAAPRKAIERVSYEDGRCNIHAESAGGIVVQLDSNKFAALPMFEELVGTVRLRSLGPEGLSVEDLTFAPSERSHFAADLHVLESSGDLISGDARSEMGALQLIAAASVRNGFFEVATDESIGLAQRMRRLKHANPVFGVFAAYAFDQAGRRDQIVDMIKWFFWSNQTVPFDLILLAQLNYEDVLALAKSVAPNWLTDRGQDRFGGISPMWPMLTQGWARLSSAFLERFPVIRDAQQSLAPGLWATVVGEPGQRLFDSVKKGEFKW